MELKEEINNYFDNPSLKYYNEGMEEEIIKKRLYYFCSLFPSQKYMLKAEEVRYSTEETELMLYQIFECCKTRGFIK